MARLTFRQFKKYLEKEDFYTSREIRHLFNSVKRMDKESRSWVIAWVETGAYPQKTVEDISVEELVKDFGYKPINAFIAVDWLKHDPQAAKYFIRKTVASMKDAEQRSSEPAQAPSEVSDENAEVIGLDTRNTGDTIEA